MSEILRGCFGGVDDCSGQLCAERLELTLPQSSWRVVHGRQIGIHRRFTPGAHQITKNEQAIDSERRQQGCFHFAGHPRLEQKDRIGSGDFPLHAMGS